MFMAWHGGMGEVIERGARRVEKDFGDRMERLFQKVRTTREPQSTFASNHLRGWVARSPKGEVLRDRRVLIVEDEVFVALDVVTTCEVAGASVAGATSVRAALRVIERADQERTPFDVALVDLVLRGETSEPVVQALRERRVPFLVYTANARSHAGFAESMGARVLPKPELPETVASALADLLVS